MGKTSGFTKVVEKIVADGGRLREQAAKSSAIPLMQEKLSKRAAASRVGRMTVQDLTEMLPEQRRVLIENVGTDAVVDILRRQV